MFIAARPCLRLTPAERTAFYALLKTGLWGASTVNGMPFPLTESEWQHVFSTACQQTVLGLVYDGVCALPDDCMPPQNLLVRWVAEVDAIERRNRETEKALRSFCKALAADGIAPPILLKGQSVAQLYLRPERRACGDIDLYFPSAADAARATALALRLNKRVRREPDRSIHFLWQGIDVELHPRLFDIAAPLTRRRLMSDEHCLGAFTTADATSVADYFMLPTLPHLLLLNAHILKHVMGRGIGLRQLCDMARAYHQWAQQNADRETAAATVRTLYRKARITRWSRLLSAFLVNALGLPASEQPYTALPASSLLERRIFDDGNFGCARAVVKSRPVCLRKVATAMAFFRHARFSCIYAPREVFWRVISLIAGQFRSKCNG